MDLYSELSAFEILELTYLVRSDIYFNLSIFMTALFGYIATAHFAAGRLSKFQLLAISSIYSSLLLIEIIAMSSAVRALGSLISAQGSEPLAIYQYGPVVILAIAWIISIIYMVEARKNSE